MLRDGLRIIEDENARVVFDISQTSPMSEKLRAVMPGFARMFDAAPDLTAITLEIDDRNRTYLSLYDTQERLWDLERFYENAPFAAAAWKVEHLMTGVLYDAMRPVASVLRDFQDASIRIVILKDGPRLSPWIAWDGKSGAKRYKEFQPIGDGDASAHELIAFGPDSSFDLIDAFLALRQS